MFDWLNPLKFLISPIEKIADAMAKAHEAKLAAATNTEKMKYDYLEKDLQAKMEVLVKEGRWSPNAWVRTFIALPTGILLWKVLVFDKALGQWTGGTTDALSPELWGTIKIVLGFYFVYEAANMAFNAWRKK